VTVGVDSRPFSVATSGTTIRGEVIGTGAPVVLLHGLAGSFRRHWAERGWVDALTKAEYQVIGIDARGCGTSETVTDPTQLLGDAAAADVIAVLNHLGVDRAPLVGYSMGSGHALRTAIQAPDRVSGLVLGGMGGIALAIAGHFALSALHTRQRLIAGQELLERVIGAAGPDGAAYAAAYFEALARDQLRPPEFSAVRVPCLLVVGAEDNLQGDFAALAVTQIVADTLPMAERQVLNEADHATCLGDPRFMQSAIAHLDALRRSG
jgi:pimeloyl-ACP methyl ester carboxylesterase